MTEPIYLAEAGIETIIYLIAVVVWIVGNILSRKRKKTGQPPLTPRPGETTAEAELREFLETIGRKTTETVTPVAPPTVSRVKEKKSKLPKIQLPQPVQRRNEPDAVMMNIDEVAQELRDGAPSMASSFSTTLSSGGSIFKTTGLTMPSLRYALSSPRPRPAIPVISPENLKNPRFLREIMSGSVIIGPPRAFSPYDGNIEYKRN
jgi:hypothetical protein